MSRERRIEDLAKERVDYFRRPIDVLSGTIGPTDLKALEDDLRTSALSATTLDPNDVARRIIESATAPGLRNPLTLEVADGPARLAASIWGLIQSDPLLRTEDWHGRLLDHALTAAGATLDRSIYCWIDAETTGLRRKDHVWEFCYSVGTWDAIEDATPIRDYYVKHTEKACEWVLRETDYLNVWGEGEPEGAMTPSELAQAIIADLAAHRPDDVHFVGAAPGFDRDHAVAIFENLGIDLPWNYHVIDIENLVMPLFDLKHPPILRETARLLGISRKGKKHSARSDMILARDCHMKILKLQSYAAEAVKRALAG